MPGLGTETLILRGPSGITDITGNGHNGTFVGNATTVADTGSGGISAFSFDGNGDRIDLNQGGAFAGTTCTLWAKVNAGDQGGGFIKLGGTFDGSNNINGVALGIGDQTLNSTGRNLVFAVENIAWKPLATTIDTGWHHYAVVGHANRTTAVYMDGALVAEIAEAYVAGAGDIAIGGYTVSPTELRYLNCLADDVRIYPFELTLGDIDAIYNDLRGFNKASWARARKIMQKHILSGSF